MRSTAKQPARRWRAVQIPAAKKDWLAVVHLAAARWLKSAHRDLKVILAPMHAHQHAREAAPLLPRRRMRLRLCVRQKITSDAFGNSIGQSLVDNMSQPSMQEQLGEVYQDNSLDESHVRFNPNPPTLGSTQVGFGNSSPDEFQSPSSLAIHNSENDFMVADALRLGNDRPAISQKSITLPNGKRAMVISDVDVDSPRSVTESILAQYGKQSSSEQQFQEAMVNNDAYSTNEALRLQNRMQSLAAETNAYTGQGLQASESAFSRGWKNDYWSALEGEKPISYEIASGLRATTDVIVDGLTGSSSFIAAKQAYENGQWFKGSMYGLQGVGSAGLTVLTLGGTSVAKGAVVGSVGRAERVGLQVSDNAMIVGPYSPLVEGGGLAAHEAAGGHLILKHVGKTEAQLMQRLANEPFIPHSSSFYNRLSAERAVSEVLDARQTEIANWLASSSNRLRLDKPLSSPAGISVSRGQNAAMEVGSARVVLERDASIPSGYKVFTGFPTKP